MSYTKEQVLAFLNGEAPIDGVWFGAWHPDHRGEFWWRKVLLPVLTGAQPEGIAKLVSTPKGMVSLTLGQGHTVHGTDEAISYAQAVLIIDSKHPVEAKDIARYFERLAQDRWEQLSKLNILLHRTRIAMRELLSRLDTL